MKDKKYTIKDIADLAGVSKGTVDRVLHNRGKVSEKALDAINQVLEQIDYKPNILARSLKNNKIYHICVLLPDPNQDDYWNPCVEGVKLAVEEFKSFGVEIDTLYFDSNSTVSFEEVSKTILNNKPDAILLTPFFQKESLEAIESFVAANTIVCVFNDHVNSELIKGYVGQDLFQSGKTAARLMDIITMDNSTLLVLHIDEAFINAIHMQEKEKGFVEYFNLASHKGYEILTLKTTSKSIEADIRELIMSHPDISGVFVTTSKAYKVAKVSKKLLPESVKLIGYDLLDSNIDFLKEGTIDFLIHQNPKTQTHLGVRFLAEHFLFGKDIPKQKFLSIDIINSENLESYLES